MRGITSTLVYYNSISYQIPSNHRWLMAYYSLSPPAASRTALFCLRSSKARSSISLDRSISSKLFTRSFTLPLLLLLGISIGADGADGEGGDTGRSSTSRLGTRDSVGIRLGG